MKQLILLALVATLFTACITNTGPVYSNGANTLKVDSITFRARLLIQSDSGNYKPFQSNYTTLLKVPFGYRMFDTVMTNGHIYILREHIK